MAAPNRAAPRNWAWPPINKARGAGETALIVTASAEGGFSGQPERYRVDTRGSAQGAAIEAQLEASGFFAAGPDAPAAVGADLRRWTITVDNGRRHTISFVEDSSPAALRWQGLLDAIRGAA